MRKVFTYFVKELHAVIQAPIILTLLLVVTFALAYPIAIRQSAKQEQATVVKVDSNTSSPQQPVVNAFEQLTASELRQKSRAFVDELRSFIESYKARDDEIYAKQWGREGSEEEKRQLWNKRIAEISKLSTERNFEYERRFKVDAVLLRDELRRRVKNYEPWMPFVDYVYQNPVNYFGFNDVANDIEALSKMLVVQEKLKAIPAETESRENVPEAE